MEHPPVDFDTITEPLDARVAAGLARVAAALKASAWKGAMPAGLTPTQGQALLLLKDETTGVRLATVAASLAVSPPTASDILAGLVAKGFVSRGTESGNRRAAAFGLTPKGHALVDTVAAWPAFLARAVETLPPGDRTAFYRSLIAIIRALQEAGDIPVQRLCVTCGYFRPNVRLDDVDRPHVCALVGAPFGDRHLRLDCREQQTLDAAGRASLWARFAAPATPVHATGDPR